MTTQKKAAALKTPPKNRLTAISAARKAAFAVLLAVERGHKHSDDLLRSTAVDALSAPDRNLATALVLGVLRWQIQLDRELQILLTRPNGKLEAEILIALRLGAFQLRHMDRIPARAAIDESVELAKQSGHRFASGMVNAVLRKLSAAQAVPHVEETSATLALSQAHPAWIVDRWVNFFGVETAQAICRHGQSQPALSIRMSSGADEAELAQAGVMLEAGALVTASRIVLAGDVTAHAAVREGRVRVQDEGSQLVAELASAALSEIKFILDACAAPGGKTLILSERNPDARIVACEQSEARLVQLRTRIARLGDKVECRLADSTAISENSVFDLALVDAPCSGTGTLGRNPEIRHRLCIEDLPRQAERQRAILHAALRAIRPGGRVVYSTCSLEPEENELVVARVLAETSGTRAVSLRDSLDLLFDKNILAKGSAEQLCDCLTSEGYLRLLPGAFGTDGFFVALIERTD